MSRKEVWRPISGTNGGYSVSNLGRMRSEPRMAKRTDRRPYRVKGRILKAPVDSPGYKRANILIDDIRKVIHVHVAMLEAFVGRRPKGYVSRHLDGNKLNNKLSNLAWGTYVENEADKRRHGRAPIGERNGRAKLSERNVRRIRTSRQPAEVLALQLGVSDWTIYKIRSRRRWKHIL